MTKMPTEAVMTLQMRLTNQNELTRTSIEAVPEGRGEKLKPVFCKPSVPLKWRTSWASRVAEASVGSGCKFV